MLIEDRTPLTRKVDLILIQNQPHPNSFHVRLAPRDSIDVVRMDLQVKAVPFISLTYSYRPLPLRLWPLAGIPV